MADTEGPRPSGKMLEDIARVLDKEGGAFSLRHSMDPSLKEPWMAALERETAVAYGLGTSPAGAVEKMLRDAGV